MWLSAGVAIVFIQQMGRQAVDARAIFVAPVVGYAAFAFFFRPAQQGLAFALVAVERNAVAARGLRRRYGDYDDLTGARPIRKMSEPLGPGGVARSHHLAFAVEPEYQRLDIETAEHHRDAAVAVEMGRGCGAAAGEGEISHCVVVEAAKSIDAFGGEIDAAVAGARCGEKQMLACDEVAKVGSQRGIKFSHRRQPRRNLGHCGGRGRCSAMVGGAKPNAWRVRNCEAIYAVTAGAFGSTCLATRYMPCTLKRPTVIATAWRTAPVRRWRWWSARRCWRSVRRRRGCE